MGTNTHYLVIDLEATCTEDDEIPRTKMEIIEIGAVMVEAHTLKKIDEWQSFVKPQIYPTLTPFCRYLTKITQQDVESAPTFSEAILLLQRWFSTYDNPVFCSWGGFDKYQFIQDCEFNNAPYPFGSKHINLKREFSKAQNTSNTYSMDAALNKVGLPLEGTHHRGIDDAHNIANLLPYIFKIPT